MSKIKNYSRHIVVLLVAFATVFTCLFAFTPEADAGATNYKWRVSYQLDQGNNNTESCYVRLYYKTNNGTGSETYVQIEGDDITFDKDKHGWYYWTSDSSVGAPSSGGSFRSSHTLPAGAFPTKVDVYVYCESGSPAYQEVRIKSIKLEVMNQSGSVVAASGTADLTVPSSKDAQNRTATVTIPTTSYPYVTNWSISGLPSTYAYVNRDGSNYTATATITAEDNYGVNWVNAPTTTGTNVTVNNGSTATPTVVFGNKDTDYSASITSKWSTGNSSQSTVSKTYSISTVYVPHKLTIDANGGTYSATNPITGKYSYETAEVSNPTRTAYTFDSWTMTSGDGVMNGSSFTFGKNDSAIKANWTPVQYTIAPVYEGNSYSDVAYNIETTSISLPTPSRTGYTFAGWVVSAAAGNWTVGESVTTNPAGKYGNITVSPSWTPNSYTLNLNANKAGASVSPASKTVKYETAIGDLPVPTVTAYDFIGWFDASQGGSKVTADTVYTTAGNSTVYAQWSPTVYKFIIDENGGDTAADGAYNIEAGVIPEGTTRTGYTFSHWEVKESVGNWVAGSTVNPGASAVGKYGDVTLKAVYTPNNYTLNLDLNTPAGAVTEPECEKSSMSVTFDNAIGTLPVPTLDGYDFAGWYTLSSGGTAVNASTVYKTASDSTVYATWTPKSYTIIIDEDAGVAVPDGSYTIESGVAPEGTTRTGYTFSHWKVKESVGNWLAGSTLNPGDSMTGKYGNVELIAVWTANKYTVSFDLNDTEGVSDATADKTTIQATYDAYLDANETLPVATRPGYNFLGWFTQPEGGEEITESLIYTVEGESTYYAHWELVTYTVSFNVNNGNPMEPITYTVEDELVLPEAVRDGYEFITWRFLQASTGSWVRNTTYKGDLGNKNWGNVTLTADYKIKTYTITWDINGEIETSEHEYGTYPSHADPAVTTDPYYEYLFTGWTPDIELVTGPTTYTAEFEKFPKSYNVKWVDEDGNTIHSGLLGYGETIPTNVVDAPSKEGYTVEWDYSGHVTMPAENIVIKPVYTPIKYKITWNVEGTEFHYDMVDYDSLPVYSGSTPVKAADSKYTYTFAGWTPEITVVKGEATYEATFDKTPQNYTVYWYAEDGTLVTSYVLAYGSAITNIPKVPEKIGSVGSWVDVPETMPDHNVEIYPAYVKGALVTWYLDGTADGAYYQQGFENGTQIEYNRSNPEKPADAEYTYTFEGWSETPGGELISGYPVAGSTDIVYYAVYSKTPNEYTITWKADGNVVLEETIAYGSGITNVPAVPDKKGHTGKWGTFPATMPSTNVTVEAVYTPNDYTITWVVGDEVYPTLFTYGTMPVFTGVTYKPSTATTDFTFTGWDKDITLVEGDTTYTALYSESARKYTVTWQYENGAVIETDTVANGEAITYIPVIAEKEGHEAKYEVPAVMPTENITITVTYEAKSYTITWNTPAGLIEETWKYGETPVYDTEKYGVPEKAATPEKQYTFLTWSPSVSTVKGDTTYTAIFSETTRKYTVVWYVDGEFYETRDIAYGSVIPTLPVPAKDGYIGNWDNAYRTMPAKDLTINSEYTARKYTVYWKVEGLTVYSASVSYGDVIPEQKVPEKLGYTGAWVNVPEKMPAQNITITAEYKANEYNVTWRVNGVDNHDIAQYGTDYVITFTGETIPEDVRITVGGTTLAVENYTYNLETGVLTIKGTAILGDIFVTARALGGKLDVVINSTNASLTNQNTTINERQAYHTQIIPEKGYLLPDFVEIYVDGRLITEGYVYNPSTGKLTINAEVVLGAIEITFDCPPDPDYDPSAPEEDESVKNCGCNCHSKNAFIKFFFDFATFLRKLFGMEQYRYCDCGAAHW